VGAVATALHYGTATLHDESSMEDADEETEDRAASEVGSKSTASICPVPVAGS